LPAYSPIASPPSPTSRQWWESIGLRVSAFVVRRLPYRFLVAFSKPLGSLAFHIDRRGRKVAEENLVAAFGSGMDARTRRRTAEQSYQSFARTMLELFWSPRLKPDADGRIFTVSGLDPADSHLPAIYVTTHYANFEWLGQNIPFFRGPGIVVAQKFKNPLLGPLFDRLRSSTGHALIPQERALFRMLRHLKSGGYFCMVLDLNLDPDETSVIIDEFSGLRTCVTQMHAALAQRTNARIVPCECRPQPDGRHELFYHQPLRFAPGTSAAEIAQACWDTLEPNIRRNPEHWLWSYKHWRYRPSAGDQPRYPAYSNTAKRFDKALKKAGEPTSATP
jgi:lauroyl/myristoyl acyltransferase